MLLGAGSRQQAGQCAWCWSHTAWCCVVLEEGNKHVSVPVVHCTYPVVSHLKAYVNQVWVRCAGRQQGLPQLASDGQSITCLASFVPPPDLLITPSLPHSQGALMVILYLIPSTCISICLSVRPFIHPCLPPPSNSSLISLTVPSYISSSICPYCLLAISSPLTQVPFHISSMFLPKPLSPSAFSSQQSPLSVLLSVAENPLPYFSSPCPPLLPTPLPPFQPCACVCGPHGRSVPRAD